jgi:hypothetical protein
MQTPSQNLQFYTYKKVSHSTGYQSAYGKVHVSSVTSIKMTVKVDFAVTVFLILHVPTSPHYEEELWYIVNPWPSDFHQLNPTLCDPNNLCVKT